MLKRFTATLISIVALDLLWLGVIAKPLYATHLGAILRSPLGPHHLVAGLIVWVLLAAGITLLSTLTLPVPAPAWGALFGLVVYGTYELTNYALIASWPFTVVLVDIAWGCMLCGTGASVASRIEKFL